MNAKHAAGHNVCSPALHRCVDGTALTMGSNPSITVSDLGERPQPTKQRPHSSLLGRFTTSLNPTFPEVLEQPVFQTS
eukprot:6328822-Amphidinium_carterae.1